ncbi:MAG: hypothetical protein A2498_09185 [Lentisphaerae bacterium RIFOXYC12_FULL_60_16]|nr:MAG: hypothetical protein A2498_09185 [Lentisphaerae bacterium RIFOXYC12_FULL_60_16]
MDVKRHERFHLHSLDELRQAIGAMGLHIPVTTDVAVLGDPLELGGRCLPNRCLAQPMEGFDALPDGGPGPLSFRRYARYARGGFGLIWVEATAVLREARSNPGQLFLHRDNVDGFRRLVDETRRAARETFGRDLVLIIQLTHSGRYSKPDGMPRPLIAHRSPVLDPLHDLPADYPVVTDDYLDRLQDTYVEAARLAAQAGFDGVDIKSCHRYLVSELHASFTREGRYGGAFENRTRLLRETLARIRTEVPGVFVCTRLNAFDAIRHPYGFGVDVDDEKLPDLTEPIRLVRQLKETGISVLNISIGNPYFNPHYGRPYDFPIQGFQPPEDHPLCGIDRFLSITRAIQETFPDLPVVGSGYSWLRQFMPQVAAGVIRTGGATLFGIGRGAFAYPDGVRDLLEKGAMDPARCCVACSGCTQIMRDGGMTGCVVRDSEIYAPQYRLGRRFSVDRLRAEAKRCRDCEEATCTAGCPAHVQVPAFIKAFADGDLATAYVILRARNALPEMCAMVCPSEVQCEGHCLEKLFCDHPIPIRDIQRVVCRLARRAGMTGVRLPEQATGRTVAVVGGGPGGVAGAIRLLERGHAVTILERGERLGGTPDSIIPGERYREADTETEAILKPALAACRLTIRFGTVLGRDVSLTALCKQHDAVLLAPGLGKGATLGSAPNGVMQAMEFLRRVKTGGMKDVPPSVAVIGGGNTAMDAAVTARQLGARDVYLVYRRSFAEMPAWPAERDHFLASGGHCLVLTQPTGYLADATGRLEGVRVVRTELGEPDASGRRRPVPVTGSESVLRAGLVLEALGQEMSDELRGALDGLTLTAGGLVQTESPQSFRTSMHRVYAAGDIISGGTTAVQGIAEGLHAADQIHEDMTGRAG